MRRLLVSLIVSLWFSTPAMSIGSMTSLMNVQEECAQIGDISFGENQRWKDCRVTRGRWVSTIDITDMYQAQYCLGNGLDSCDHRALLLFGNRAYTPVARLLVQRIDSGETVYEDPLVVKNEYGRILTISARLPDGDRSNDYYMWKSGQWIAINAQAWLHDLEKRLPGVVAKIESLPDVDSMSAKARIYCKGDSRSCSSTRTVNVELGVVKNRFTIKSFKDNQ